MVAPLIIAAARVAGRKAATKAAQRGASSAASKSVSSEFMSRKSISARAGERQYSNTGIEAGLEQSKPIDMSVAARKSVSSQFMSRKSISARIGRKKHEDTEEQELSEGGATDASINSQRLSRQRIARSVDGEDAGTAAAKKVAASLAKKTAGRFIMPFVLVWSSIFCGLFLLIGIIFTGAYAVGGLVTTWTLPEHLDLLFYSLSGFIAFFTYITYRFFQS